MRAKNRGSVPNCVERNVGLDPFSGFDTDPMRNDCRLCLEKPAEVLILPCRHSGLCESCLRRTVWSKPAHRGGRDCPFCRKRFSEVLRFYDGKTGKLYAYT